MFHSAFHSIPSKDYFYAQGLWDVTVWWPDFEVLSEEALLAGIEEDGTADGIRHDATLEAVDPETAVREYVSGMAYALVHALTEETGSVVLEAIKAGTHKR